MNNKIRKDNHYKETELFATVRNRVEDIVQKYLPKSLAMSLNLSMHELASVVDEIRDHVFDDLQAYVAKDPAAAGKHSYVFDTYKGFQAVMYYRICRAVNEMDSLDEQTRYKYARKISEDAKVETGVEIHPGAQIGKRLVIDHGINTVIGETCVIGSDCYILNGVILGNRDLSSTETGKRHPTLGDHVTLGAYSRVFGDIAIGNNVFISPYSVITRDIPDNSNILIVNQLQIILTKNPKVEIYGLRPINNNKLCICGKNLSTVSAACLVNRELSDIDGTHCEFSEKTDDLLVLTLNAHSEINPFDEDGVSRIGLKLAHDDLYTYIVESRGLTHALKNMVN
jgi:serine O-acetyltransferase